MSTTALAVTVGDPGGNFLPGFVRLKERIGRVFSGGGAVVTDRTHPDVVRFVEEELGWPVEVVTPDGRVGLHRRQSLELALESGAPAVLYSDADHILRWLESAPDEVTKVLDEKRADLVVVGRSQKAMATSPARLRDTERLVNHIYELMTGNSWDLMFAIRWMTRAAAIDVVENCSEDSIANDVEWPLYAQRAGMAVAYVESDHLEYRIRQDFDGPADDHDHDPAKWISRVAIANQHAAVLRRFLTQKTAE